MMTVIIIIIIIIAFTAVRICLVLAVVALLGLIHCQCLCASGVDAAAAYERQAFITALVSVFGVAIVIIIVFTAVRIYLMRRHRLDADSDDALTESTAAFLAGYGPPGIDCVSTGRWNAGVDLEGLKIGELISHGRYGNVYRGILGADEVAIKVIRLKNLVYFLFYRLA